MIKIAIIGSRGFSDYEYFKSEFELFLKENNIKDYKIVSGGARGADTFGRNYAKFQNIEIIECVKFLRLIYEDDMESEVKSAKGLLIEKSVERFINAVNINEVGLFEIKLSNDLKKIFFYVDGKIFQSDNI